jgi:hypothetical protein
MLIDCASLAVSVTERLVPRSDRARFEATWKELLEIGREDFTAKAAEINAVHERVVGELMARYISFDKAETGS